MGGLHALVELHVGDVVLDLDRDLLGQAADRQRAVDHPEGAAGGDASESAWNRGVLQQLKALAAQRGNLQVRTWDSVIANDPNDPRANWNRAQSLYEQWKNRNQGGR